MPRVPVLDLTGARSRNARVPAAPRRSGPAPLRLTRRGRAVVVAALVLLLLGGFVLFSGRSAATAERGPQVPVRTVVVEEGDTLWGIASQAAGPGQVRDMVYRIEELNSLPGPELVEGQKLAVPAG